VAIEFSTEINGFGIVAEVGRNFVSDCDNQWVAGIVGAHACGAGVECLVEVHETQSPGMHETLLNLGLHWKLDESTTLLAAAGREVGTRSDERRQALVHLGVQFTR
jgi:lipid A disaccharide synthetase